MPYHYGFTHFCCISIVATHMEKIKTPSLKTTFSGLVNQHEFLQRIQFMKSRILNGYTTEQVAFLLGRTPYFIRDFEELNPVKLDGEDIINYTYLFTESLMDEDSFDRKKNDIDISYEKRMVRGIRISSNTEIKYEFVHPWTNNGICKPLKLSEELIISQSNLDTKLSTILTSLVLGGYFSNLRSPMEIFMKLENLTEPVSSLILPLRSAIYRFIHTNALLVKVYHEKFYFIARRIN